MFDLFETIAIANGKPQNLKFHQQRYEQSLAKLYHHNYQIFDLANILHDFLLDNPITDDLMRCRIDYHDSGFNIGIFAYQRRRIVNFQPIICDNIDYSLKFANRDKLNELLSKRGDCDEVMIVKNGFVTDCTIGNLILKKDNVWYTPDTPLLQGTQRAKLLAEQRIFERSILLKDMDNYEEIRLINALNPLKT